MVSNSPLDAPARAALEGVAERVWERENTGLDVWAYKESMAEFGADRLADYDEVILLNSTFFGPLDGFDALFAEMEAREDLDFWGITEHGPTRRHPFDRDRPMRGAHPVALDRGPAPDGRLGGLGGVLGEMPPITSYADSVLTTRAGSRHWFRERGFTSAVAFPASDYSSKHPVIDNPVQMVRDGCPIVKRRSFFYDPLYHEGKANDGRQLAATDGRARLPDGPPLQKPGADGEAARGWPPTWACSRCCPRSTSATTTTGRCGSSGSRTSSTRR